MKVLVLAPKERYDAYSPDAASRQEAELIFCDREGREEDWLAAGGDAEALFVTPVTWIRDSLMARMQRPQSSLVRSSLSRSFSTSATTVTFPRYSESL